MIRVLKLLLITLLFSAIYGLEAQAQTISAASCSQTDVQNALNTITSSSSTTKVTAILNIPAGTCHWTSPLSLQVPSANNSLSILGAGNLSVLGGGDATVIVDDYASSNSLIVITTGAPASYFRFSGITIQGGTGGVKYNGLVEVSGTSQNVRIDHDHFNTTGLGGTLGVGIVGWLYGVADHNIFDGSGVNNGIHIEMNEYGGHSFGHGAWADATNFGSSAFFFIENNTFNNGFVNDCSAGGKQVIRYNVINEAPAQTHPTQGSTANRGCRASEVYNNTFNGSNSFSGPPQQIFWISSGGLLIWGNSAPTGYQNLVHLISMRRDNSTYGESTTPAGWGYCGTSFSGTGSAWDQNSNTSSGSHCLDQPGQGAGQLLSGDFAGDGGSGVLNTTTGTIAWPHEALEPIYEWLDTWAPVPGYSGSVFLNSDSTAFVANSDYYQYTASFNGTSGTGSGLLSARPSTCTPMVAYWATDTSKLYQCSSANTWTAYYQPYAYPHPLTQSSGSGTGPAAPTNIQIVVQ